MSRGTLVDVYGLCRPSDQRDGGEPMDAASTLRAKVLAVVYPAEIGWVSRRR